LSTEKPRLNRKKRLAIYAGITVIGIIIAFYNTQIAFPYKHTVTWDFDSYQNGTSPQGFASMSTDKTPSWVVQTVSDSPSKPNVLVKLPIIDNVTNTHLQILPNSPSTDNANITMKFKIVSGEKARSVGMIVRFIDDQHYFVLMADSMANRLSLCKQTPEFLICSYDKQISIAPGEWHSLKAIVSSQGIAATLDNHLLIRANDHNYVSGQMGLWTKADTEAYFDDFKIQY
jgi:hypothetical protein